MEQQITGERRPRISGRQLLGRQIRNRSFPGHSVVATPNQGVLGGITPGAVIELWRSRGCRARYVRSLGGLRAADEIFISSTAGGGIGVTRLDGRILSNDRSGSSGTAMPISNRN